MTTNNDNKKKKRRSLFKESEELEEKLKIARKKADSDKENSLTIDNARDIAAMLLAKALRESFARSDMEQGRGVFIHGSMQRLNASMWKGAIRKK